MKMSLKSPIFVKWDVEFSSMIDSG